MNNINYLLEKYGRKEKKGRLIIIPCYGLANRMRALISAVILGEVLRRKVIVCWEKNELLNCSFKNLFSNSMEEIDKKDIEFGSDEIYIKKESLLNSIVTFDEKVLGRDIIIESFNPFRLNKMSNRKFDMRFKELMNTFFVPSKRVTSKLKALPDMKDCIGVHIRRTDNNDSRRESTDEAFIEILDKKLEQNSSYSFFLATDSIEIKLKLAKLYGSKLITNQNELSRNTEEGIVDSYVDMIMLSRSIEIIGSVGSSFSYIASIMGGIPFVKAVDSSAGKRSKNDKEYIKKIDLEVKTCLEHKNFAKALDILKIAAKKYPYYFQFNYLFACTYIGLNDYKKAELYLGKYIKDTPFKEAEYIKNLSRIIHERS